MISVPFQNNFNFGIGPDSVMQYALDIQPVIPMELNSDWNLITRTIVLVISQPSAGPDMKSLHGVGDINPTVWLSPAYGNDQFSGIGVATTLPTGTTSRLTTGRWSVGPSVVYMATPGPWMIGAVINQQWSVAEWRDEGDGSVSTMYMQPMVIYHLKEGWYLASVPVVTANWKAKSGDEWTIPVGGGIGKVLKIRQQALNLQLESFHNLDKPEDGPDWQLRFQVQLLFPK